MDSQTDTSAAFPEKINENKRQMAANIKNVSVNFPMFFILLNGSLLFSICIYHNIKQKKNKQAYPRQPGKTVAARRKILRGIKSSYCAETDSSVVDANVIEAFMSVIAMKKLLVLGALGGLLYLMVELLWRQGNAQWPMFFIGGLCFVLIGLINEVFPYETPLIQQMVFASLLVTGVELLAGVILNIWLGMNVWDYSHMPLNIMGQICLPYTIGWFFLSLPAIVLDDYLRYWLFHEEKPFYALTRSYGHQ